MNTQQKLVLAAGILVLASLALIGFGCYEWLQEHDARMKSDAVAETAKQNVADRDKHDGAQQAQAKKDAAAITTAPQAIKVITQYVPVPVNPSHPNMEPAVVVQPSDLSEQVKQILPDAPSYIVETDKLAEATAQKLTICSANTQSLLTCQSDKKDMQSTIDAQAITIKGGTFWTRVKHDAIQIGITAGVAYAAGRFSK